MFASGKACAVRWAPRLAFGILVGAWSSVAFTQSTYDKAIDATQIVAPLGFDVGGELVNYYSGSTSFKATDLSIPGNSSLQVSVSRIYAVEPERMITTSGGPHSAASSFNRAHLFGDWDLDIPHIAGTFQAPGTYAGSGGWQLDSTTPLKRCSVIGQVRSNGEPATGLPPNAPYELAVSFFRGYTLHTDEGSKDLLIANEPGVPRPTSGGPYHWTTTGNWWVSCLPSIQNGEGEGYLAVSPDGTKYYFDWISHRRVGALRETVELGDFKYRDFYTYMDEYRMLPTKIVDRFGNWVHYEYSDDAFAKLLSITSNDGRIITLQYNSLGHVTSVSGGGATVSYSYRSLGESARSLSKVTLPDASAWDYDFTETYYMQVLPAPPYGQESDVCGQLPPPHGNRPPLESYECVGWPKMRFADLETEQVVTVKTPSGAMVRYVFGLHYQLTAEGGYAHSYPIGLTRKTISGPGLATSTWRYVFGSKAESTKSQCLAGACPTTIWTDALGPDNSVVRRVFGLRKSIDQALLVRESMGSVSGSGAPTFLRTTDYTYHRGLPVGNQPGMIKSAYALFSERRLPVEVKQISQDGRVFRRKVNAWDVFDRETSVTSTSTN